MPSTTGFYDDPRYRNDDAQFSGVVRITHGGYYGTGVLLYDGRAVLTCAHLFEGISGTTTAVFESDGITRSLAASGVTVHAGYDPIESNNDLAIVWLDSTASDVSRSQIYRDEDEIGKEFQLVGYGVPGTGSDGIDESYAGSVMRLSAQNRFDTDGGELKSILGDVMGWSPLLSTQLVADFDDGSAAHDALGELAGSVNSGLGFYEGMITPGDSGGPAFIGNMVAGVASYTSSLSTGHTDPDIDTTLNGSFGELGFWQRVSHYAEWIDTQIRDHYSDAPYSASDVAQSIREGDSGTQYLYFRVEFSGVRDGSDGRVSIEYATRDGSAVAGEDYIAITGRLVLYPNERSAVIGVEVIGDTHREEDEQFYLDVFSPNGGGFGGGVEMLSGSRSIVDNDMWG